MTGRRLLRYSKRVRTNLPEILNMSIAGVADEHDVAEERGELQKLLKTFRN